LDLPPAGEDGLAVLLPPPRILTLQEGQPLELRRQQAEFPQPPASEFVAQALEATLHGRDAPRAAVAVAAERPPGVLDHPAAGDLQGLLGEVDDALHLLALALTDREDPAGVVEIDERRLDGEKFVGPRAGVPGDFEEVGELPILHPGQDVLK